MDSAKVILASAALILCFSLAKVNMLYANTIIIPQQNLVVDSTSSYGTSFTYSGNLTDSDVLGMTVSGVPCLTSGGAFCVNAAGVAVVAGDKQYSNITVGNSLQNTQNNTTSGSLLLAISGIGVKQIFTTNSANGSQNPHPPTILTLPGTSLLDLGFNSFSTLNPTITFKVSDTDYTNNSGNFFIAQSQSISVSEPSSASLLTIGVLGSCAGLFFRRGIKAL